MPEGGVEPPWAEAHTVLSRARIPIPPLRHHLEFYQSKIFFQGYLLKYNKAIPMAIKITAIILR